MIYLIAVTEDDIRFAEDLRNELLKYPEVKHVKIVTKNKKIFAFILSKKTDKEIFLTELTERERAVLSLRGDGYKNREIALKLGITSKSVGNYASRIVKKLGLKSVKDLKNII
jgi:DNA-binding NarL/FixJ family response regulator